MSDTIVLNGLMWDTENLEVNGETHFTYKEAKIEATKLGKRLPTKKEFSKLLKLPHVWDADMRGMWFAEREEDLKTDKSLFLPAKGYIVDPSVVRNANLLDVFGTYWSSTSNHSSLAKFFGFSKQSLYVNVYYKYGRFTIRCVSDLKQ